MARPRKTVKVEPVEKKWLNKQEAIAYLGCGERYLTKLRDEAKVSFSRDGKMIWYDLKSLDQFITKNKVV